MARAAVITAVIFVVCLQSVRSQLRSNTLLPRLRTSQPVSGSSQLPGQSGFQILSQSTPSGSWSQPPPSGSWSQPPFNGTGSPPPFNGTWGQMFNGTRNSFPPFNGTWSHPPFNGTRSPPPFNGTWSFPPFNGTWSPMFNGTRSLPPFNGTRSYPPFNGTRSPPPFNGTWSLPPFNGTRSPMFNGTRSFPPFNGTWSHPPFNGTRSPPPFNGTWSFPPFNGTRSPMLNGTRSFPPFNGTWSNPPFNGTRSPPSFNGTWSFPPFNGTRSRSPFNGTSPPRQSSGQTGVPTGQSRLPTRTTAFRRPTGGVSGQTRLPTATSGQSRLPTRTTAARRPTSGQTRPTTAIPSRAPTRGPAVFATNSKMSSAQVKDLQKVFDANSVSSFTGTTMFDPSSGGLTADFKNSLDSDEQAAVDKLENDWKNVIDLTGKFNGSKPEDVQFFAQLFRRTDETKLTKLTTSPSTFQPDDVKDVPLEIIGAMNDTLARDKLSQLPQPTVDEICKKLEKGEVNYKITKTIVKGLNCSGSFTRSTINMCGTLARAIADNKMADLPPRNWTNRDWEESIRNGWLVGLPFDIIIRCPDTILKDNMNLVNKLLSCLDKRLRDSVMDKIKSAMGGGASMTASDISSMGSMVADLPVRDLKKLDVSVVKNSLSTFSAQAQTMNSVQKAQIKQMVKQTISNPANMTGADIADSVAFVGDDKDVVDQLDKDVVAGSIDQIGQQKLDRKASKLIAKKLMESSDYDSPTKFTVAKLKKLGSVLDGLSADNFKKMSNVDFGDALSQGVFKDQDISKDSSRVIVDKITTGGTKLSKDDFKNLGKAVTGLKKDHIDNMTADDLKDAIQNMTDTLNDVADDMDATTVNSMLDKMSQATGGLVANLESLGQLQRSVSLATLQNASDSDFGDMSGATERNFNCTSKTCPEFFKRVTNTIGTPSLKNSNYTVSVFKNLKYVMCGMSTDVIKSLPATSMMDEAAGYLLGLGCLSDKQERDLAMKKKLLLGILDDTVATVDTADLEKSGGLMKHFSSDELKKLGDSACPTVVQVLGQQDLSNVQKDDMKNLAKFAVECMNKTDGTLSADDMSQFGSLVCGLSTDKISDIAGDAMQDVVVTVQKKCPKLSNVERSQWASCAIDKLNMTGSTINDDDVKVEQMGTLVRDMDTAILDQINASTWKTVTPNTADQFKEMKDKAAIMTKKGYGKSVSDTDKTDADAKDKIIYGKMVSSMATTVTVSGRRKRSTTTLTCSDMQLLGSGVTSMTTSQIEAIADQDYLDCASTLGGYSTWTTDQLASLLTVAIRSGTYGSHTSWSADDVYTVSIVAQALTSSELSALTALSIDSMYSLGRHDGWGETKLASGFARWLSLNKGDDASTITSTELIALGNFACGATTTHIASIDSTKYSYSASYIGALSSCAEAQLEAYATLAKAAFGAVSTWDTSVISTVGAVIGGLSASELATLSTAQVAAIDPTVVALIPSTAFVGFTVDQLSGYSVAQAQSTTTAQHVGLSTAQRSALVAAGATIQSAASATQVSVCVLFLSVLLTMLNFNSKF